MSAIALKWVSEIRTGSSSAKHLLLFMATHNFSSNKNFFSIRTLCEQLELSERSVQTALKLLIEQSLIIKEERYKKDGGQTTNCYELNIPETYAENYFNTYVAPPATPASPPRTSCTHNNNINNNTNKTERERPPKRASLSVDFIPNDETKELFMNTARLCEIDPNELYLKFENINKSSGKISADWNAELQNFLLREKPSSKKRLPSETREVRSTVPEWGPGHPSYDSMYGTQTQ